jgi:hypothetical protein
VLVCALQVILFGCNVDTTKKGKKALIDANKELDLEVNTGITRYVWQPRYHNAGTNRKAKL